MLRERVECKIRHVALASAPRFFAGVGNRVNARACISAQIHTKVLVKRGDTAQGIADQRLELDVEDRIRLIVFAVARLDEYRRALRTVFAYLTADFEAVTSFFSDPDKLVKADPFPFLVSALIIFLFGPGKFSIDAAIQWVIERARPNLTERNPYRGRSVSASEVKAQN